jgi:hypothetical protein
MRCNSISGRYAAGKRACTLLLVCTRCYALPCTGCRLCPQALMALLALLASAALVSACKDACEQCSSNADCCQRSGRCWCAAVHPQARANDAPPRVCRCEGQSLDTCKAQNYARMAAAEAAKAAAASKATAAKTTSAAAPQAAAGR